jgi:glycosyltransferase involved in cell wall biosynthesis
MKLFILSNNINRASFRQRIGVYLKMLRSKNIDCEIAKLPSGLLSSRKVFQRAADFDCVFLHKKGLNPISAFLLRKYSKKIIYNFDDAVMYDPDQPSRTSGPHMKRFIRSVKVADMVLVGSSYLAEQARKYNSNINVLPLGLKVSDYECCHSDFNDGKIRLVWIGSKSTLKYLEELKPTLEEIGSLFNNVVLRIIGDGFFDLQNMEVEKRLWSKKTRAVDLATSDIGLAPLPDNRFTKGKCSFKVLEYASAGLPVIASPVGTNSDYIRNNVTGFFARDSKEWIDRIAQLINNPQSRKKVGQDGRTWAKNFDVSVIGKQLTDLIGQCLKDDVLLK